MASLDKVLYTARAHTTGGRDGASRTDDGRLDVTLSSPGTSGSGTNPEQLFAAGYAACFHSALKMVARTRKIAIEDSAVTAEVGIGQLDSGGFGLTVALHAEIGGVDQATADELVAAAHEVCPYSNATRGNIEVTLNLV